jgi:hypothetical protein
MKWLFAIIVLFAALQATGEASPHPVVWCGWAFAQGGTSAEDRAYTRLCSGDAEGARVAFKALLPLMEKRIGNGQVWIDFYREYFYALIASHHDAEAFRFLTGAGSHPTIEGFSAEERHFWNGNYAASFAAYVADDAQYGAGDPADHKLSPHLSAALAAVRAGELDRAVAEMKADPDRGSLYDLMRGNLYAEQRRWAQAFDDWITAAQDGPLAPEMEFYSLDRWNGEALHMLYYYRAHAPTQKPAGAP